MWFKRKIGDFIRKINPLEIEYIKIPVNAIPGANSFNSFKIAHVSDVHIPRTAFTPRYLAEAVKNQKPDIIFLTGDIMDGKSPFDGPKISLLISLLLKIAPVVAISGNHEVGYKKYEKIWKTMLKLRGVVFVDNSLINVDKEGKNFVIAGIKDFNPRKITNPDLSFLNEVKIADDDCFLLLHHRPNIWRNYYPENAPTPDIVFSGHAHGGQIRIPFTGRGIIAPNQGLFPKYISGLYEYPDGSKEIISRGLASVTTPVRINNNPHLIIVELFADKKN